MISPTPALRIEVVVGREAPFATLQALSRFRGSMLYANGSRPTFASADGCFDDDSLDVDALHVLVRTADGEIAGCVRACTLEEAVAKDAAFARRFVAYACEREWDTGHLVYGSRWIVDERMRGSGIGRQLMETLCDIARGQGKRAIVGAVGTRYGQYLAMHAAAEARILDHGAATWVPRYGDEIVPVVIDLTTQ